MRDKAATIKKIIKSATEEFTEHGFEQSSIRTIAKKAGITPGAIYKHFSSKEDIFEAIVGPTMKYLNQHSQDLMDQTLAKIVEHGVAGFQEMAHSSNENLLDYIYDNIEVFNLVFNCGKGTKYEFIRHDLVTQEVEGAKKIIQALKNHGVEIKDLSDKQLHILHTMAFTPLFEIITHQYSYEEALTFVDMMRGVMNFGWHQIIKLSDDDLKDLM